MKSGIYIQHTPAYPIRFVAVGYRRAYHYDPIRREVSPEGFTPRIEKNYTFVCAFPMPAVKRWLIEKTPLLTPIVKIHYRGSLRIVKLPLSANMCKGVEQANTEENKELNGSYIAYDSPLPSEDMEWVHQLHSIKVE